MHYWQLMRGEVCLALQIKEAQDAEFVLAAFSEMGLVECADASASTVQLAVKRNENGAWLLSDSTTEFVRELDLPGDLIYHLSDRIIFHLADKLSAYHCLHAAAVSLSDSACVIPAKSGAGKSSLTAWLVANQLSYITDELIMIDEQHCLTGIARPIQIKPSGIDVVRELLVTPNSLYEGKIANAITASMLGGSVASQESRRLGLFLFPRYSADSTFTLTKLSSAEAGLQLMSNHVNARNLKDHGFRAMMSLIRETPCYSLEYGGYDKLPSDFCDQLNEVSNA